MGLITRHQLDVPVISMTFANGESVRVVFDCGAALVRGEDLDADQFVENMHKLASGTGSANEETPVCVPPRIINWETVKDIVWLAGGKHKGLTIREIINIDPDYFDQLLGKD